MKDSLLPEQMAQRAELLTSFILFQQLLEVALKVLMMVSSSTSLTAESKIFLFAIVMAAVLAVLIGFGLVEVEFPVLDPIVPLAVGF